MNSKSLSMKTPFMWSGSKDRSYKTIKRYIPTFERYAEPFIGGGGIYFRLLAERGSFPAICSDINDDLLTTYEVIRDDPQGLIDGLPVKKDKTTFQSFLKTLKEPTISKAKRASMFLYLNRNRFFGMGGWMVADRYARDAVIERIQFFSPLMQQTNFIKNCWNIPLEKDTFVFCDPPYPDTNNDACYANPEDDIHHLNEIYFQHVSDVGCPFFWVTKYSKRFNTYISNFGNILIEKKEWKYRKPGVGVQNDFEIYVSRSLENEDIFL